jgi:hypothetical protein
MSFFQKLSLPESHGKSTKDFVSLGSCEGVEEEVEANANGSKVLGESLPQPVVVCVCASHNCSFTGSFCSNKISHALISLESMLFENTVEAARGKLYGGFVLVCCHFDQSHAREHGLRCFLSREPLGIFLDALLKEIGWCDVMRF